MNGEQGAGRREAEGFQTFAVGLTGLFLIIKSLASLPGAVSWLLFWLQIVGKNEAAGPLVASIAYQWGTFAVYLTAGALVLWKRERLGRYLSKGPSQSGVIDGMSVAGPLVGVVGIWILVSALTAAIAGAPMGNPALVTIPFYIAYGLQVMSGLFLLVSHRSIGRFLVGDTR